AADAGAAGQRAPGCRGPSPAPPRARRSGTPGLLRRDRSRRRGPRRPRRAGPALGPGPVGGAGAGRARPPRLAPTSDARLAGGLGGPADRVGGHAGLALAALPACAAPRAGAGAPPRPAPPP